MSNHQVDYQAVLKIRKDFLAGEPAGSGKSSG